MSRKQNKIHWWILPLIILSMTFTAVCSLYFFKEKLLVDTGFRAYHMANILNFSPSNNRHILIFNQILPLISLNLGASLKTYLQIISLGNLAYFALGAVVSYVFLKEKIYSLLFVVAYVFFFGKFFFHIPDMEIHLQAFFFCLLGLIYFKDEKLNWKSWCCIILLCLIISFGHPIGLVPLSYLLFLIIYKRGKKLFHYSIGAFLLGGIIYLRILNSDSYEVNQFNIFTIENSLLDFNYKIFNLFELFKSHISFCIILIVLFIAHFKRKSYFEFVCLIAFLIGYTIIVLTYNSTEYAEAYFLLMGTSVLILSFHQIFKPLIQKKPDWTFLIIAAIMISEWNTILKHSNFYTEKTNRIKKISSNIDLQNQSTSFFLYPTNDNSMMTTFEFSSSILLSTIYNPKYSKVLIPKENIPFVIQSMWPFMDSETKKLFFPDSTNIHSDEKLSHYADVIFSEEYLPKNRQKMWNIHHINPNYFTIKDLHFKILK